MGVDEIYIYIYIHIYIYIYIFQSLFLDLLRRALHCFLNESSK
jgi:hypothetical protein